MSVYQKKNGMHRIYQKKQTLTYLDSMPNTKKGHWTGVLFIKWCMGRAIPNSYGGLIRSDINPILIKLAEIFFLSIRISPKCLLLLIDSHELDQNHFGFWDKWSVDKSFQLSGRVHAINRQADVWDN